MIAAYGVHVIAAPGSPRAMSLDIMIAADHQGRGLIADLAGAAMEEARARGAQLLGVVANARARDAMGRRLGWRTWRVLADWTAPTSGVSSVAARIVKHPKGVTAAGGENTFYPRDDITLAWRTVRGPRYQYRWLETGPTEAPDGWAVVKVFRDPVTAEGFGDVLGVFPRYEAAASGRILDGVRAWLATQRIDAAAFYPIGECERSAAQSLGFSQSKRERYFCGDGPAPHDIEIGMLDVDVY